MSDAASQAFSLKGRRFIITGGSGEIGMAIAARCAALGARIGIYDLDPRRLEQDGPACGLTADNCAFERGSVEEDDKMRDAFARLAEAIGGLDGLITCAGRLSARPLAATSLAEWRADMAVNLDGVFLSVRHALPLMADGGTIVFVSSVTGHNGSLISPAYAAGKAALLGLARSLVHELRPRGIRVNCISPGVVDTAFARAFTSSTAGLQQSGHPPATPMDVANAVAFLSMPSSAHVNGESMILTGGAAFA